MKIFLITSITINLILAALVVWLLHPGSAAEKPAPATTAEIVAQPRNQTPSSPPLEHAAPLRPFRWSQLESTNYHTYIANLRGIGCPEQTIRDLITADVDEAFYVPRRVVLKEQFTGQPLQDALEESARQETALVTTLLGGETVASATPGNSPPPRSKLPLKLQVRSAFETSVNTPLVLEPADLSAMKLTDAQTQIIGELRQTFLQEVGTNQDPNDPAYLRRWQTAQREADNMLIGNLGINFVLKYQKELEDQAARPQ